MVKFSSLGKCAAIPLALSFLTLGGCGKVETPAPEATGPASAVSPVQKSATPNSFDEVATQLDPGGDFYLYLSTEQWLTKLSKGIDSLHDLALSGSNNALAGPYGDQTEKGFAVLKDMVQKSGLEEITGLGATSFAVAPGLHRNKVFVHHYPDKGSGILWSLLGKEPHALTGLDFLPADTAAATIGDFDLAQLINFLRQEANDSGIPEAKQAVAQWQTQFAGVSGLQLDDVLGSLNGSMGMILTLDASNNISVPIADEPQTIPAPRLALLVAVKNDLIFKQVDKMLGSNPGVIKVNEADLRMLTMPVPMIPALNLRPSVAQWNGFLVIASDDQLIRDMIAVQKGAPGYKSTPEYVALSAGLPQQGNRFGVTTQRFADTLHKVQSQMQSTSAAPAQAAAIQHWFSTIQKVAYGYGVGSHLPNGWLTVSQFRFAKP
jgi:hypothetical protein